MTRRLAEIAIFMYASNDILFPYRIIGSLKDLRGETWAKLVTEIVALPENDPRVLAFMLMMVRLNGCMSCETDSYRAMRGCTACAHQTLRRFKGDDDELMTMYDRAQRDIRQFRDDNPQLDIKEPL